MSSFNRAAVDAICADVVGRRNEIDVVVAALAAERQRQQIAKAQKTLSAVHLITPQLPA